MTCVDGEKRERVDEMGSSIGMRKQGRIGGNKTTPTVSWKLTPSASASAAGFSGKLSSAREIGAHLYHSDWEPPQFFNNHHPLSQQRHLAPAAPAVVPDISTHLLNRIFNLQQQLSRNKVLIKSLKRDIHISRAQIKTLLEQRNMEETNKEAEVLELKSGLVQEKKTRILLENLCDEFAKGMIRDYQHRVNCLDQSGVCCRREPELLHVSEAWFDERLHKKTTSISHNLSSQIQTFLQQLKNKKEDPLECCSNQQVGVKANTLMAKLLEARLESQFSKSKKLT